MMDVIHLFFEEDAIPQYEQHAEIKSAVRTLIYEEMYKREYRYKVKKKSQTRQYGASGQEWDEMPDLPPPADNQEIKPYIPPTNPEDLPGILDGPLG